ncbi:HAD family hydrolase [Caballeronia mineralivorans PML1(12)]|uniref:HAD family hydrolase n=1 Tax=Caballeronia mineralivorans PML1(12) TaxID=908627 RepID=A0A0J1G775_9BURK|nr:HAD family phosphatase [Caballeronia mineralivorans]KLU28123.1 HAD family hydrolase [Caballeronia mineralivorans PML1(12)]
MTTPISLVLFDMDDVLCHYDRSARVRHLAALSSRTFDEVRHAIWDSGLEAQADAGLLDDAEYLNETECLLNCPISKYDWLLARRAAMTPNLAVLALATAVAERYRVAVLTNNPRMVADNIGYLCPAVANVFRANVFASASFKAAKPAAETYHRCLDALDVSAAEVLFVDDLEINVAGAREAGLHGHLFTGHEALSSELRCHNLL